MEMVFISLFHNYTAVGTYLLVIKVEDWSGEITYFNRTIEVQEYKSIDNDGKGASRLVQIIIAIVMGVVLLIALVTLGYVGYKFSKKETKVDFELKDMKSDIEKEKAGTGTDFDKRRTLQIPRESIMKGPEPPKEGDKEIEKELPMIKGKVTFDEE